MKNQTLHPIRNHVRGALLAVGATVLTSTAWAQSMAPGRQVTHAAAAQAATGIRPQGDTEISIDMSQVKNPDLPKIFKYIDAHIDEHVRNLDRKSVV